MIIKFLLYSCLLSCFTQSLNNNIDRLPDGYTKIELRNICLLSFFIIIISTSMFFLILSESNYILTSIFIFAILLFQYYFIIYFEKKLPIHIVEYIKNIKKSKSFLRINLHNLHRIIFYWTLT